MRFDVFFAHVKFEIMTAAEKAKMLKCQFRDGFVQCKQERIVGWRNKCK